MVLFKFSNDDVYCHSFTLVCLFKIKIYILTLATSDFSIIPGEYVLLLKDGHLCYLTAIKETKCNLTITIWEFTIFKLAVHITGVICT